MSQAGPDAPGADPAGTDPARADPARADPARADPARADPAGADRPGAARGGGFVRRAREADAASLARVQVASWRYGYAGIIPDALLAEVTGDEAETVWRDRWRQAIGNPPTSRHRVLVAIEPVPPRAVVGFVSAGPATDADRWPGTDGELYELRVAPGRTGHGHASRLLHAAADTLAQDGFHTVAMWVLDADSALRQFLESAGWAADGARSELDVGAVVPALRLHTRIGE